MKNYAELSKNRFLRDQILNRCYFFAIVCHMTQKIKQIWVGKQNEKIMFM